MKNGVKRALVTGSSKGIGRATSLLLAQNGWELGATARSFQDLEGLCQEIQTQGGTARAFLSDLGQLETLQTLAKDFEDWQDGLDLLVCNAGVGVFKPFEEMTLEDWDFVMDVNLKGTYFLVQALLPLLKKSKCPRLIFVTSDVARRTFAQGSLYCMSKYAQDALALTLRKELRPHGVRVSVVMPGLTDTSFGGSEEGASHKAEWLKPIDVAQTIAYIANSPQHVVLDEVLIHPFCQDYQG